MGDCYAGCGGNSLGSCMAGCTVKLAVEIDSHAVAAYSENLRTEAVAEYMKECSIHDFADIVEGKKAASGALFK